MNKREQAAVKKAAILKSADYKAFVYYRRQAPNPPSDYYKAYTTDKALRAPQEDRTPWSKHPFEADWGKVDSPTSYNARPASKPKAQPIKTQTKPKPQANESRKIPMEEKVKQLGERMSMHYGAPPVEKLTLMPVSARKSQMVLARNRLTGAYIGSELRLGMKGNAPIVLSTAAHEFGHHIHARGDMSKIAGAGVNYNHRITGRTENTQRRYKDEVAAWKIAQPFINELPKKGARPIANWSKRYALQSYSHYQEKTYPNPNDLKTFNIKWRGKAF